MCCHSLSQYTGLSASVDAFLWEHPDVLLIAAAGNRGTISAPSPLPAPPPPTTPTLLPPSPPTPSQMQPNSQAPADKGNKVPQAASDGQSTPWSATAQSSSKAGASTDTASEGSIPDVGASSGASASISTTGSDLLQTGTVEPPATAKNSLAVGAAVGLDPSGEPGANLDATVTIKAASGEVVVPGVVVRVQQGGFGRHEGVIAQPLVLVVVGGACRLGVCSLCGLVCGRCVGGLVWSCCEGAWGEQNMGDGGRKWWGGMCVDAYHAATAVWHTH